MIECDEEILWALVEAARAVCDVGMKESVSIVMERRLDDLDDLISDPVLAALVTDREKEESPSDRGDTIDANIVRSLVNARPVCGATVVDDFGEEDECGDPAVAYGFRRGDEVHAVMCCRKHRSKRDIALPDVEMIPRVLAALGMNLGEDGPK